MNLECPGNHPSRAHSSLPCASSTLGDDSSRTVCPWPSSTSDKAGSAVSDTSTSTDPPASKAGAVCSAGTGVSAIFVKHSER